MRPLAVALLAAALAAGAAQAQTVPLPSAETPNATGSVVLPIALSTPPPVPEQRSYSQLLELWKAAGAAYGIPWEVLGAINKIESNFGRNMGPSSAGALGWMQFMPSTWERWGLDADGDRVANPWDPDDAIYAAARYLAASGGRDDVARAIFSYNHADWYVRDVLELAQVFAGGGGFDASLGAGTFALGATGPQAVFRVDDLEAKLADARKDVNRLGRRADRAEERLSKLQARVLAAEERAGNPNLTNAEFERIEADVTALVLKQEQAVTALADARKGLDAAVAEVADLRSQASAEASTVTFTRDAVTAGLGTPQYSGQYVFPVGGGPSVVSVSATHHDYPAADIAAPEGSPLYALADAVVVKTYPSPTGRCGIGLLVRLADGNELVYCHLSYLERDVVPGAALAAGSPVGLVGSTGNSTGPHLHLQFVPATRYPQGEAWFQSFAGIAFSWQGEAPDPAPALDEGPVITFSQ